MKIQPEFNPAGSYDIGTYLWAIGCHNVDSPEMQSIEKHFASETVDRKTAKFGFDKIEAAYDATCARALAG